MKPYTIHYRGQTRDITANSQDEAVAIMRDFVDNAPPPPPPAETMKVPAFLLPGDPGQRGEAPELPPAVAAPMGFARGAAVTGPAMVAGAADWAGGKALGAGGAVNDWLTGNPAGPSSEIPPGAPRPGMGQALQASQEARYPYLADEAPGEAGRIGTAVGEGTAMGLAMAPFAAMTGPTALAAEAVGTFGGSAVGQFARERGSSDLGAMAAEAGMGMSPALFVRNAGKAARRGAVQQAAAAVPGRTSPQAFVHAARQVQKDTGSAATRQKALTATSQALEDFPAGTAPIPYQVLAGSSPQVPGQRMGNRTRQLMSGPEEFGSNASDQIDRARQAATEFGTEVKPLGTPEAVGPAFRGHGAEAIGEARAAYKALPLEEQGASSLGLIGAKIDEITTGGTVMSNAVAEDLLKRELATYYSLVERYGLADAIPVRELDAIASSLKAKMRNPNFEGGWLARDLLDSVEETIELSAERSGARAAWREAKQTYEPTRPKPRSDEASRARWAAASALGGSPSAIAKNLIKPKDGATVRATAQQVRKIFKDDPEAMQNIMGAFADEIFGLTDDAVAPNTFKQRITNRKTRQAFKELFGNETDGGLVSKEWDDFEKLMRMRNQAEYSQVGRQGEALTTSSASIAQDIGDMTTQMARAASGDIGAWSKVAVKVLRFRFGTNEIARIYQRAMWDTELYHVMLKLGDLGPEEWAEAVYKVAVRRGIIAAERGTQ